MKKLVFSFIVLVGLLIPTEICSQKKVIVEESIATTPEQGQSIKRKVAIGRFSNETEYGKGLFYDKDNDPMGKQALDILSAKLGATNKFILLERNDLASLLEEANKNGQNSQQAIGADFMIIGSITEFGRKNTSQSKVFSSSKTQSVEAAVSIRLVDVSTGQVIFSDEGKGSAEITTKTGVLGTGGHAGYDATLSDKAIAAAISQLVENIINKLSDIPWRSYFLSYDADGIIIAGGKSQGLKQGMIFDVKTKGKKVKNPQTGIVIELPGKTIGKIKIDSTGGDTAETEYAFVSVVEGDIDVKEYTNYVVEEIK